MEEPWHTTVSADRRYIATTTCDSGGVDVWDTTIGEAPIATANFEGDLTRPEFSGDGSLILIGTDAVRITDPSLTDPVEVAHAVNIARIIGPWGPGTHLLIERGNPLGTFLDFDPETGTGVEVPWITARSSPPWGAAIAPSRDGLRLAYQIPRGLGVIGYDQSDPQTYRVEGDIERILW